MKSDDPFDVENLRYDPPDMEAAGKTDRSRCCDAQRCDHVWCDTCDDWRKDTGMGPSCAHGEAAQEAAVGWAASRF